MLEIDEFAAFPLLYLRRPMY